MNAPRSIVARWAEGALRAVVAAADGPHARWVGRCVDRWEARQSRDADGLLNGAAAYQLGDGARGLLAVHGFADSPAVWRPMAERWAQRHGLRVRAMRLPGSAEPVCRSARVRRELWLDAVAAEAAALRRSCTTVWAVGHSLGAALLVDAVASGQLVADGLLLLAPLVRVSRRRSPLLTPERWFELCDPALRKTRFLRSPFGPQAVQPALAARLPRDAFFAIEVYRALFEVERSIQQAAACLTMPMMAVLCGHDRTVDPDAAQQFLAGCPAVRKQVLRRMDCGHAMPVDTGWEALADRLAAFLDAGSQAPVKPAAGPRTLPPDVRWPGVNA